MNEKLISKIKQFLPNNALYLKHEQVNKLQIRVYFMQNGTTKTTVLSSSIGGSKV